MMSKYQHYDISKFNIMYRSKKCILDSEMNNCSLSFFKISKLLKDRFLDTISQFQIKGYLLKKTLNS